MNIAKEAISLGFGHSINPITGQIDDMTNCLEAQRQLDIAATNAQENRS